MRAPRAAKPNKWLVTVSITFGTLMGAIDSSIVNVALPHIRGAVGASLQEITWITTGYVIATVLVMPLTAFLGRQFGQKRVYVSCLVIFLVGSALCGIARSLTSLVIYRAIQGFGAGALQPTEQAILRQTFSKKEQGLAMALFSMAIMLGPAIGPTLGGYIVDNYSWDWIFYINLPVGILGLVMVLSFVHDDEEIAQANLKLAAEERKNLDWPGIAMLSVGLSALQYFLEEGARNDWFEDRAIAGCFAVAVVCLVFFVVHELSCKMPVVNLRLFLDPVFSSGTLIGALMFALLMANMFLLPIYMQDLLGFTAMQSGLALMPRVLVMMTCTPIIGKYYNVVSPRLFVGAGVLLYCVSAWQMSHFNLAVSSANIVSAIMIQGAGFSLLYVPLTTLALQNVPRQIMSEATGLNSLMRQIGSSMGLAIFATLLDRFSIVARNGLLGHLTDVRPEVHMRLTHIQQGLQAHGIDSVAAGPMALRSLSASVAKQAMVLSFDRLFLLGGIVFLMILPLLFFLRTPPEDAPAAELSLDH
jgi:DHA2 family multidrug resistance protein